MKKLFVIILMFISANAYTQMYAEFAVGATNSKSAVLGPSVGINIHNAFFQTDLIVLTSNYQPVMPGIRAGYTFHVDDFGVQAFIGRHFELFTTDKYDAWKNHFTNMFGMKLYYRIWFLQAQVSYIKMISFGLTEKIQRR